MSDEVTLDDGNFDAEVLKAQGPVLVDFWAPWCGPCRMIAPALEAMAAEYKGRLKIGKLNVDDSGLVAQKFGIVSIPTLIIFKDGKAVDKKVGAGSRSDLERFVAPHLP